MRQEKVTREDSRKKAEQQHLRRHGLLKSRRELITRRRLRLPVWKLSTEQSMVAASIAEEVMEPKLMNAQPPRSALAEGGAIFVQVE